MSLGHLNKCLEILFADSPVAAKGVGLNAAAQASCHVGNTVTKDAGTDDHDPVCRSQNAFEPCPESQHTFTGHEHNLIAGAHEACKKPFCASKQSKIVAINLS